MQDFTGKGGAGWRVYDRDTPKERRPSFDTSFMKSSASDSHTFRLKWDMRKVTRSADQSGSLVALPEYYKLVKDGGSGNGKWVAIAAEDVPAETGLDQVSFKRPQNDRPSIARVTPEDPDSCWKKPGPAAGPFKVKVGDGSTVTYCWYRFADQPALLNADLADWERERLQKRAEMLHRHWTKERQYLAPPTVGKLADIDPALIVTPPRGMEAGYVPLVTRQAYE